jgi:hypothetical protein
MKPNINHVETRLAAMLGEPTLVCCDLEHDVLVQISAQPMLGMDVTDRNALCYPVVIVSPHGLASAAVSDYVSAALDQFDLSSLDPCLANKSPDNIEFRVFVDVRPVEHKGCHIYHAVACVSATPAHIESLLKLAKKQLDAFDRLVAHSSEHEKGTLQ